MIAGIVAAVFGMVQMLLLNIMLRSATSGQYKRLGFSFAAKGILYAAGFALLFLLFRSYLIPIAVGYFLGLILFAAVLFIYYSGVLRGDKK